MGPIDKRFKRNYGWVVFINEINVFDKHAQIYYIKFPICRLTFPKYVYTNFILSK